MQDIKYIHYGSNSFDPIKFHPIKNVPFYTKPGGDYGLAEQIQTLDGKIGVKRGNITQKNLRNLFNLLLLLEANIIEIHSCEDLKLIPQASLLTTMYIPDFESLALTGVDAIEVFISEDIELYDKLLGWDVNSILIMNPNILVFLKRKGK